MDQNKSLKPLVVEQVTFEFRYAHNFLLWDRAGSLWKSLEKKWPKLVPGETGPVQQAGILEPNFQGVTEMKQSRIMAVKAGAEIGEFGSRAHDFHAVVRDVLEISAFSRLGLRLIHSVPFDTIEEASSAMLTRFKIPVLSELAFGANKTALDPTVSLRWKGEAVGCLVTVKAEEGTLSITRPFGLDLDEFQIKEAQVKRSRVYIDIDYYTTAELRSSQVDCREWVTQAYHYVKKELKNVWS